MLAAGARRPSSWKAVEVTISRPKPSLYEEDFRGTYGTAELVQVYPLLLRQFARIIKDDSAVQDVGFPIGEVAEAKYALRLEYTLREHGRKEDPDHAGEHSLNLVPISFSH